MGVIFEWLLEWFLQQSLVFQICTVVALLTTGYGLWKTYFSGEKLTS